MDHHSALSYVFLQRTITSEDTLEAKRVFDSYSTIMGVKIQYYHADNGRFADNMFMKDIQQINQTISFCGVGDYHQNNRA